MDMIIDFLKQPLVGSVIGILGIIIGAILAIVFYMKSKVVAKPMYSIENARLIDLSNGVIPDDVYLVYSGKQMKSLFTTTIKLWNSGKKTINKSDLEPPYVSIPFSKNDPALTHFIKINARANHPHIKISTPKITDTLDIHLDFNFLDYKDCIEIDILHTAKIPPSKIIGYVKGVPKGFVNVSDRQEWMNQILTSMMFRSSEIISRLLLRIIQTLYK